MLSKILVLALAVATVVAVDPTPPCPGLIDVLEINSMTPTCRQEVVDMHNDLRGQFARGTRLPKAANMKKLVYSEELEQIAQQLINTCSTNTISGLKDAQGNFVGQLTYSSWSSKNNPTQAAVQAFTKWSAEKDAFSYPTGNSLTGKPISTKFLQLINANTVNIGCNRLIYTTSSPTGIRYNQMYVCCYTPSVGSNTVAPYESGAGCDDLC